MQVSRGSCVAPVSCILQSSLNAVVFVVAAADSRKDAANPGFTDELFWDAWVSGLNEIYHKSSGQTHPMIEFKPTKPNQDYMAVAFWDRFTFLAARQADCTTQMN